MKKAIVPGLLIAAMALGGCAARGAGEAVVEEKVIPVEVSGISLDVIERKLIYAGQVKPSEQVYVVPKLGGKVTETYFDVGDRVNKDDVLFEIDDTDIQSSISSAQAQLNVMQAGVSSAQIGLENAAGAATESTLLQLESAIASCELAVSDATNALANEVVSYENSKVLYEAGAMSKTAFDGAELKYNSTVNGLQKAQDALRQAQESYDLYINKSHGTSVKAAQTGVSQATASAESARVALANAERNLDELKVKSPLTGVVSAKSVTVGAMAGQTSPAYTVIDIDTVEISVNVSEELINVISPGMSVPVYISSVSDEPCNGVISTISPAAEEVKNTYPVKITVSNPDGVLKPGMFTEVHFTKEKSENTVVVARNTVLEEEKSRYIFVAENGLAKKYFVETGIDNGKEIEITGGLPQNAMIITKGQTHVSDGDKIKVVE